MRYYKIVYYTDGDKYETNEMLVDEPMFRKCQTAVIEGNDFLVFKDRVIKRNLIKEMSSAREIIDEYLSLCETEEDKKKKLVSLGLTYDGLLESGEKPELKSISSGFEKYQKT